MMLGSSRDCLIHMSEDDTGYQLRLLPRLGQAHHKAYLWGNLAFSWPGAEFQVISLLEKGLARNDAAYPVLALQTCHEASAYSPCVSRLVTEMEPFSRGWEVAFTFPWQEC